ncbi:TetR/AcrR family transcriptional regulator [Nonomuraea jiangxiensis]|uniref:DNA-binding transcriptional regulator, AcrR family n=1 Tax=Nonomuraea jiangxiensis TaxID=633440 RepID=A0A1G8JBA2_9ACTN|nr:TetR/AcrR family transcriptional regulator [Nonomuraea jiangxiensis]SDI28525.1 DNA-binding transcriptional regulator, AcrR family [Nonomuraea jiangxiensis]
MSRPLRADAQRNRARVLQVAAETFAKEGLSVPVHEIARRAGVGTGTVSRHFPTKESLFEAVLLERMAQLVRTASERAGDDEPGEAFFGFFSRMVEEGAANKGLVDALAGAGYDFHATAADPSHDVMGAWGRLLRRGQDAGAIRADVDMADVKALLAGCLDRERDALDPAARARMLAIVRRGLGA